MSGIWFAVTASAVLGGAIAAVWIVGGQAQLFEFDQRIAADPDHVFRFLVEPDLLQRWNTDLVESRPLDDGQLRVGARSIDVVDDHGRRMELETVVRQLDRPSLLVVTLTGSACEVLATYVLSADGDTTHVQHRMQLRSQGLMRFLAPFVRRAIRDKVGGNLDRLATIASSGQME